MKRISIKLHQNQTGFTALHTLLFLVIVGIIGFAGWKVYDANKSIKNTSSSAPVNTNQKPATSNIPEGFVIYENKDLGLKFIYPATWASKDKAISIKKFDSFEINYGISGAKIGYNQQSKIYILKDTNQPVPKQPERTINNVPIYNFGGGDGGDPACSFGVYVFAIQDSIVKVSAPTACEFVPQGSDLTYTLDQQAKDVKQFLDSISFN